ncbi:hypothetical protein QBC38DRAFT_169350 [Podospora fimiseda]|uniref:Uncharacterized protein n=1 Tax=Podospora fimiseda TaxID=252190 RepID=A0AAN7BQQ3_9PEZI|nr:hypothetical protein QBC38DRAFT_169350 [Podospora fimiseda]
MLRCKISFLLSTSTRSIIKPSKSSFLHFGPLITTTTTNHYQARQKVARSVAFSPRKSFSTTTTRKMSDEDYLAFLNKANQNPSEGVANTSSTDNKPAAFKTLGEGVDVPKVLQEAVKDEWYISDADEKFQAVGLKSLRGNKQLPDEEEFAKMIGHWDPENAEVEILDPVDWDGDGKYNKVLEGVRKAGGGGDVRVYKVGRGDGVRWEYWVLTLGEGNKVLGAKVLAVES